MEAMLHGVDASPTGGARSVEHTPCGINWQWIPVSPTDIRIQLYGENLTGTEYGVCQIVGLSPHLSTGFYLRFQIVPSGAGGTTRCQAWDTNGTRFFSATQIYSGTTGSHSNGVTITGAGTAKDISWGYFKMFTTVVDVQARMPVHSENGNLLSWKFDSALTDGSGLGYNGTHSGAPSYTSTPGQTLLQGLIKTSPAPTWTDRRTLRVGVANPLNAASSFTQSDASASVSCDWSVASTTPSSGLTLTFDDATNNCTPTATPNAFGDYYTTLTITDAESNMETLSVHIGAVEMDANGVVAPSDPRVTTIFGSMIALGWNPWGLADERHVFAHTARRAAYVTPFTHAPSYSLSNPPWATPRAGTVVYQYNGKGNAVGAACTTLNAAIMTPTQTSIQVTDAACLDLTTLPTKILIQATTSSFAFEEIDICATTGSTGAQTLTVCYFGRGKDDAVPGIDRAHVLAASTWSSGAVVGQALIKGTGTDFMGGAEKLCEAGAGPAGPIKYSTGTVGLTAGLDQLTGSGTAWVLNTNVAVGDLVRVEATHSTGTPFMFYRYVESVDSGTAITLNGIFPADADTASGLTYQIIRPWFRRVVTSFAREAPFHGSALVSWGLSACTDDTHAFFNPAEGGHDSPGYNGDSYSGETYSFEDSDFAWINQGSTGGVNFYGEDLAWDSLYFRSGLAEYKETALMLSNNWVRFSSFLPGFGTSTSPLFMGGGVIGGVACKVVLEDCALEWDDLRQFFYQGKFHAQNNTCTSWDSRDGGYLGAWLALGALFDPDEATHGFRDALEDLETLENSCKGADNSWSNGFYTNFGSGRPSITLTNGSATGTGTGLSASVCWGRASGTFSISGSTLTATSGTFSATAAYKNIVLTDASGNRVFAQVAYVNGTTATLNVVWPGDSTGTWLQVEGQSGELIGMTVWGNLATDNGLDKNYECTYVNSTTITLERPWVTPPGASTPGTFIPFYSASAGIGLAGKGQQPYMLAIKLYGLNLASQLDGTLGTDFAGLLAAGGTWGANTGYDSQIKGMRYGTGFQSCEPSLTGNTGTIWKQPGCSYGTDTASQVGARMLNGEAARVFMSNTANRLARGDEAYAALWCSTTYNDATLYPAIPGCDAAAPGDNLGMSNLTDTSFSGGKWPGFFFGMGMAHQWAAERLLGSRASTPRVSGRGTVNGTIR